MDGIYVKTELIGFKCTPELKLKLFDAAKQKGITVSKLICYVLMDYLREVPGNE